MSTLNYHKYDPKHWDRITCVNSIEPHIKLFYKSSLINLETVRRSVSILLDIKSSCWLDLDCFSNCVRCSVTEGNLR